MKYRVDVVVHTQGFEEPRFIVKDFADKREALGYRAEVVSAVVEDERVGFSKVYPVVTCVCGEDVDCQSFTNECECGADYNFNGMRLAPRSQWGEETGEQWQDII